MKQHDVDMNPSVNILGLRLILVYTRFIYYKLEHLPMHSCNAWFWLLLSISVLLRHYHIIQPHGILLPNCYLTSQEVCRMSRIFTRMSIFRLTSIQKSWYKKTMVWLQDHDNIYRPRSEGDNVLGSIRPSICPSADTLTAEPFDLRPWYFVCRLTLTLARLGL